jgi:hypothetical protein
MMVMRECAQIDQPDLYQAIALRTPHYAVLE